jgi:hypothetical protein
MVEKSQIYHIVGEVVVILGVIYYFNNQNKQNKADIQQLQTRLKACEEMNMRCIKHIQNLYDMLSQHSQPMKSHQPQPMNQASQQAASADVLFDSMQMQQMHQQMHQQAVNQSQQQQRAKGPTNMVESLLSIIPPMMPLMGGMNAPGMIIAELEKHPPPSAAAQTDNAKVEVTNDEESLDDDQDILDALKSG